MDRTVFNQQIEDIKLGRGKLLKLKTMIFSYPFCKQIPGIRSLQDQLTCMKPQNRRNGSFIKLACGPYIFQPFGASCCNIYLIFSPICGKKKKRKEKGFVLNITDIKLIFHVNDFQQRTENVQLTSAGQVTHRGTNRKHSSSKEPSFISAQPVMQFNHSLGTPCREDLK